MRKSLQKITYFKNDQTEKDKKEIEELKNKRYNCKLCEKTFASQSGLKPHMLNVHEGMKYQCKICQKGFTFESNLERHIKTIHEGLKRFNCKSCGKRYAEKRGLLDHENFVHKGLKKYKCHFCEKSFGQKFGLTQHIETFHEGKRHICETCGKEFKQRAHLKFHIKVHHDVQKNHKCDICGDEFFEYNKLKKHIRNVHQSEEEYMCEICDKIFCQLSDLNTHHVKIHTVFKGKKSKNKSKIPVKIHKGLKRHYVSQNKVLILYQKFGIKTSYVKVERLKNSSENQEDLSKIEINDGQIYSSNLKKLSISLAKFSPKFCDKCDKYFCSERALQKHIDFAHLIENILLNDDTDIHKNGSEIFVEKSNNIESAQIAQKVICKICKKQFISAKDIMEHSVLEHSVETTQFTKDFILLPNNKENVKIKNIEIIKSERNQLDIHSIKCHICKEKVPVKDYASHCKEIHRINCVIKKLEKNNIDMSKVPKLCYDGSK